MALVNYYLTDSEGDTDVEEDTPPVSFSAPTPVTEAAPPVEPPAGPRRPHWLPPVRPLAGPSSVRFSAPTSVAAAAPPGPRRPPPVGESPPLPGAGDPAVPPPVGPVAGRVSDYDPFLTGRPRIVLFPRYRILLAHLNLYYLCTLYYIKVG